MLEDLSEKIHERGACRATQLPLLGPYTSDETSSEEPATIRSRRKQLKSGKLCKVDTPLRHRVVWPQEFVYLARNKGLCCVQQQFDVASQLDSGSGRLPFTGVLTYTTTVACAESPKTPINKGGGQGFHPLSTWGPMSASL